MKHVRLPLIAMACAICTSAAFAQAPPEADDADAKQEIIVTAPRIKGSVDTDLPLEMVLDENAIASYGASSLSDLLGALGNQTQSTRSRGQGGGFPVVLLNGRRVSGFQEMRDLPPEAIKRVEILPEDVAVRFGYAPGQRVVNFILKEGFSAVTAEAERGGPTSGGRATTQIESGFLRIGKKGRVNVSAQYEHATSLSEKERDVLPSGADTSGLRTLLPRSDTVQLNGTVSRSLTQNIYATLNAKFDLDDSHAVFGLPLALIASPSATPFDVLDRNRKGRTLHLGASVDQGQGRWRWTVTGSYDRARILTLTDRNSASFAQLGALPRDVARSLLTTAGGIGTVEGSLVRLPAGNVKLSLKGGFEDQSFRSFASSALGITSGALSRQELEGRAGLDVPILDRNDGLGRTIGDFSLNGNYAYSDLSDFGGLDSFGYGFSWSPLQGLTVFGSVTVAQAAPTPQQLGDPRIVTPNVAVYDYTRASTVLASLITGGNAALKAEEQRDRSLSVSISPKAAKGLQISGTYTVKRSDNLLAGFPSLNFETERAFPAQVTRDGAGNLLSIDQRAINFFASRDDTLRWGMQFSKEFGQPAGGGGMGGSPRGPRPDGAGAGPPGPRAGGGGRGGGFPMGGIGGGRGGRWTVSLYHTLKLNDDITISPGLPLLDRLNGSATGFTGGTPRHRLDLEGGWFNNGVGIRAIGAWRQGSRVEGGATAPDLYYSGLGTLNARLFVNFDQQKKLIKSAPFLKGSRIVLRVDNMFNSIQKVKDQNGLTPLRYQPAYLDPLGRVIEVSFRKLF